MSHYRTDLRDIEFNLFEVLRIQEYLGSPPFEDFDVDTTKDTLREIDRLSREEFAASFAEADREPPRRRDDGGIELPESLKRSLDAVIRGGWHLFGIPTEIGGYGAPDSLRWAASELLVGANPAAFLYTSGMLMARVLADVATPEQIERFAKPMVERTWGGTMVLTEPDAGSDVGAGTTKAIHVEGDVYHLEGVKRFITSAGGDYFENIIHLVLARPEGGQPGTKGLSMFIVPQILVNEDGSLGDPNGVVCTNLEDKMGIKGSTTCELTFGMGDRPAVGYLVGGVHDGIRQMFQVIEDARMLIGVKSAATLSTGYLNALEYATERVQGPDMTRMRDKTAPKVPIIAHPDVRRMLMDQKAYAEGMRALVYYAAMVLDRMRLDDDPYWAKLQDLLLPMVKGYCSERAYEQLTYSLQVFGGNGYLKDYPLEQYIRDAKIDSIYEGTTAIQALDLFFRKIVRDQGQTLTRFSQEILETVKGGPEELVDERALLGQALEDVQAHIGTMVGWAVASQQEPSEIYKTGLQANALLFSLSEVVIAWLLLRHAEVALGALPDADQVDRAFYEGKVFAARWFVRRLLPQVGLRRRLVEEEDGALMELPIEAF